MEDKVPLGFRQGFEAGIREVVDWIKEASIMGYKEGELGVKPPTDLVLDLYLWQAQLKEWDLLPERERTKEKKRMELKGKE